MRKNIYRTLSAIITTLIITLALHVSAFAANAEIIVTGGDETHKADENYAVVIEISSAEQIGTYYIELAYDAQITGYVSGADSSSEGMIVLTGTGTANIVHYNIDFKNSADGAAGITVKSAVVNDLSGNAVEVSFKGTSEISKPEIPVIGSVQNEDGKELYVLDQSLYIPEIIGWNYKTADGSFLGKEVTFITDFAENIHILCMTDIDGNYYAYAVNEAGEIYLLHELTDQNDNTWFYTASKASITLPDTLAEDPAAADYVIYAINSNGVGGFYNLDENSQMILWEKETSQAFKFQPWMIIALIAAVIAVVIVLAIILIVKKLRSKANKPPVSTAAETTEDDIEMDFIDLEAEDESFKNIPELKTGSTHDNETISDEQLQEMLSSINLKDS